MLQLLQSFKEMAQANKELAAAATAARTDNNPAADNATPANNNTQITDTSCDAGAGAVALTGIKVPLDMGRDAEERLVNFHFWKEEVADRLDVAGVTDEKQKTTIAFMWGVRDKAGVIL